MDFAAFCGTEIVMVTPTRSRTEYTRMPRDPNDKLYKRKLRGPYWVGRTRNI